MRALTDYSIILRKKTGREVEEPELMLSVDILASRTRGKLIVNPIYKIIRQSKDGIHLWRKRENIKWELEALMMMKAMPLHVILRPRLLEDIQSKNISTEVLVLMRRGVIIEVPDLLI